LINQYNNIIFFIYYVTEVFGFWDQNPKKFFYVLEALVGNKALMGLKIEDTALRPAGTPGSTPSLKII
jgi:hypothetical protein